MRPIRSLRVLIAVLVGVLGTYVVAVAAYLIASVGAVRGGVVVLALGGVILPLLLLVLRRRFWGPLARLERGLQQVSDGDLTAQVPVANKDELGRVAGHFNQMTRVLRDRAEEQGRFAAAGELPAGGAHEGKNPLLAADSHAPLR